MDKLNLKEPGADEIRRFMGSLGLPAYRDSQLMSWIYLKKAVSIQDITEFSRSLRSELEGLAYISNLEVLKTSRSSDGTVKYLFGMEDGNSVESVLIPMKDRITLCVSSQVGCPMMCGFCMTGLGGLTRNLKAYEIADQVIAAGRLVMPERIGNVVLMGMGEPLLNIDEVAEALWRMTGLMEISPRRITVSTCGIADRMAEFAAKAPPVNLAVSLNATTDSVRDEIMPVNMKFPLKVLLDACRSYPLAPRRRITFEYVLLDGVNDSAADAERLARLLRGIPSKVNLIPLNESEGCPYSRPPDERVLEFQEILAGKGLTAMIRKSGGGDIMAACGQLKASGGRASGVF